MAVCDIGLQNSAFFPDFMELKKDTSEERMDTAEFLQEQLVAHTLAISDEMEGRSGVWGEHSYARERGPPPHAHVRALLQPRASPAPPAQPAGDEIDVVAAPRAPPALPADDCSTTDDDDEEPDNWESTVISAAPTAIHECLATVALEALRAMRLRRLARARAGGGGRWERAEAAAEGAARLRVALAPHWGLAGWLHSTLLTFLPRGPRALYDALTAELRRAAPRLAERLVPRPPPPAADPLDAIGEPVGAAADGPWLAWVSSGCPRQDARWRRRLAATLHVRELAAPHAAAAAAPVPVERWCAERAHVARAALVELMQEAGERPVVLGGWGAGAALAAWLAKGASGKGAGGGVAALLLLAPPLLTAEGPRDSPLDLLSELEMPMLLVVGTCAAQSGRGCAGEVAVGGGGDGADRRLLLVGGADDALRLPRRQRLRARVPQQALDAAVAEECARWAAEICSPRDEDGEGGEGDASPERAGLGVGQGAAGPGAAGLNPAEPARVDGAAPASSGGNRVMEIVEGCVVSRVSGGTPLALGARLQPADIMRLPIVFADDSPEPPHSDPVPATVAAPVTVRAGGARVVRGAGRGRGRPVRYTRVIVAKRPGQAPLVVRRRPDT